MAKTVLFKFDAIQNRGKTLPKTRMKRLTTPPILNILDFFKPYLRKLYSFKDGKCAEEGADNPMMHEVMLGGHLYLALLKERCEIWLRTMRTEMEKMVRQSDVPVDITTDSVVNRFVRVLVWFQCVCLFLLLVEIGVGVSRVCQF